VIELLSEYGLFLAKAITIVVAIIVVVGAIVAISARSQSKHKEHIEVKKLNQHYEHMAMALRSAILPHKMFKKVLKDQKKADKQEAKKATADAPRRKIFVLDFHGDIRASAVASLREEITAILTVAEPEDEVLLRLESAGGLVHSYGLAASQLTRIKDKPLKLTIAVDKVAASGGYMMACVADKIISAPFAIVGSIGVLAQLPNFHRLLKKNEIDFEQFTAGEYKRTVTMFGENTDKDREKFKQDIDDTHELFKDFVARHRPALNIGAVATGEHWYGARALALNLVDELRTSDDYLLSASHDADLFEVTYASKKPLITRLLHLAQSALERRYALPREQLDQQLF
jgi:serine protease SohB